MNIHELESPSQPGESLRVTSQAWRAAYTDIVLENALSNIERAVTADDLAERFSALTSMEQGIVLVADDDGIIVGSALFIWEPERTHAYVGENQVEIRTLYAHSDRWGEGIGTRLLEAGFQRTPESVDRVVLETFEANELGRSFYESRDGTLVGETDFEIGEDTYPSVIYAIDLRNPLQSLPTNELF